jgi:hypothetical protein
MPFDPLSKADGPDDHIQAGGSLREVDPSDIRQSLLPAGKKPVIELATNDMNLVEHARQTIKALVAWNHPPRIFSQDALSIRTKCDEKGRIRTESVPLDAMIHNAAQAADFVKVVPSRTGLRRNRVYPPRDLIQVVMSGDSPYPPLRRIATSPVFLPGGRLLSKAGYDEKTGILLALDPAIASIDVPMKPSASELQKARSLLLSEFCGDVPFTDLASAAHVVAIMQSYYARECFELTPMFFVNAHAPGTGKTRLIHNLSVIATGAHPSQIDNLPDDNELRKRLTAEFRNYPAFLLIDNVDRSLHSPALAAAVTRSVWDDRELGTSGSLRFPISTVLTGTGNNTSFSTEMTRRIVPIGLHWDIPNPELKLDWKIPDLDAWVKRNRADLVWAGLTIAQNWFVSGCPVNNSKRLGSFESWSTQMAGMLDAAGVPGFLDNLTTVRTESDQESQQLCAFVDFWRQSFQTQEVTVADLHSRLKWDTSENLVAILKGDTDRSQQTGLGRFLSRYKGRIVDGYIIDRRSSNGHVWHRLRRLAGEEPSPGQDLIGNLI